MVTLQSIPQAKKRDACGRGRAGQPEHLCCTARGSSGRRALDDRVAGGVGLQLDAQGVAVGDEVDVDVAHQRELLVRRGASGRRLGEGSPDPPDDLVVDSEEQLLLAGEQCVDVRLGDAGSPRDRGRCSPPGSPASANSAIAAARTWPRRSSALNRDGEAGRLRVAACHVGLLIDLSSVVKCRARDGGLGGTTALESAALRGHAATMR